MITVVEPGRGPPPEGVDLDIVIKLDKGSIYLFNHGLQHAVGLSSSYEEWLNKWAKPFLALVGSVEEK